MKVDLFLGLVVGLLLVVGADECTTPQQQRHHTHTHILVLPHQWGGTVSTAADTDRNTHHSPAHPTGHTPSLQFTPLLPTTTPTPTPLGRPSVGEMAVTVSLALPVLLDLLVHPA